MLFSQISGMSAIVSCVDNETVEVWSRGDGTYDYHIQNSDCPSEKYHVEERLALEEIFERFEADKQVPCPMAEFDAWATDQCGIGHVEPVGVYAYQADGWVEVTTREELGCSSYAIVDGRCGAVRNLPQLAARLAA